MEDSGGMWLEEMEDSCYPFDKEFVESQLDAMSFLSLIHISEPTRRS